MSTKMLLDILGVKVYFEQKLYPQISLYISGWGFAIGILLFSGSLYVLAATNAKWLGAITPFGGLAFLAGWGWLIFVLLKASE